MASRTERASSEESEVRPNRAESAARASLEQRAGRTLFHAEWVSAQARLLEFVGIVRVWDRKTTASGRGNVEVICQREP
jgi:hypothetical protein